MQNHKQILFVVLGGALMTILIIAFSLVLPYFRIQNIYIIYTILYAFEFGIYCLLLYFYRQWVSKILWFSNAVTTLILLTMVKIILTTLLLFIIFSLTNRFVEPGFGNIIDLLGPMVRGFIIELACIGVAAKIFETDIFDVKKNENDRIIDDLK